MLFPIALLAAEAPATAASPEILVTASLLPETKAEAPVSATVFDQSTIETLGQPWLTDLLRLSPGVTVASAGGAGSQAQVRIRGAEANHTLVFVDGIAFNDPAAGNEPRFETFAAPGLARVEVVRGPQSALFGSEAIGGVVALETPDPLGASSARGEVEAGSRGYRALAGALVTGGEQLGITATGSILRGDGIDILGGGSGDHDGFRTLNASVKGVYRPSDGLGEIGLVGRYIDAKAEFDGTDPLTFGRADTLDRSRTRTGAVRGWATIGRDPGVPWSAGADLQYLASASRNDRDDLFLNRLAGDRLRIGGQLVHRFALAGSQQSLVGRVEHEDEDFHARDPSSGGAADQRNSRARTAIVAEWRADWSRAVTDLALRRDSFSRFRDATTARAQATVPLGAALALYGSYGEGIAQPTFYDLYGFYPGSFVGNPALKPERSRGFEGGVRWSRSGASISVAAFSNRFRDEIAQDYSGYPVVTAVNLPGASRRRGAEVSAELRPLTGVTVGANYTLTDSRTRDAGSGGTLRALRRPKHSANLYGNWEAGPLALGGSLAYVGKRRDTDFDPFPALDVQLGDYLLAAARVGYHVVGPLELFARVENAGNAHHQDVVGYRTEGRAVFGGVRVAFTR